MVKLPMQGVLVQSLVGELKSHMPWGQKPKNERSLQVNITKAKIMASSPSWQIGETWKQWQIFMGSKISADSDCSHEVKRHLLLERKAMTNLDSMLKNRDISLSTMVHTVKAMVFPNLVQMWELDHKEGWAPKNWYFQTVVLEKTLESSWDCKEIKPSILKVINPEYSLEGLMVKYNWQNL